MNPFVAAMFMSAGTTSLPIGQLFATVLDTGANLQASIDALPFTPGLIIAKDRDAVTDWIWRDTARGMTLTLASNLAADETAFSGYSGAHNFVAYCFASSPGFMRPGLYTGAGGAQTVLHTLSAAPGIIITKQRVDAFLGAAPWAVYTPSTGLHTYVTITSSAYSSAASFWGSAAPDANYFGVGSYVQNNRSSEGFVDYTFTSDPSGNIQEVAFNTNGIGGATFDTTWSTGAQFILLKCYDATGDWEVYDTARTSGWSGSDARLLLDTSAAETSVARISQSGSVLTFAGLSSNSQYTGMVIRAP